MTGPVRAVLRKVLVVAFLSAVAVGAATVVAGHGTEIAGLLARPAAKWCLVLALLALAAWLLLGVQTWRRVLASLGSPLGFATGARICFAAIAGTYLPGPWWQALAAAHTGRRTGVDAGRVVAAYLLVAVINLLSATAVGLLAAPLVLGASWPWLVVPLLLGAYVLWRPETVLRLTDRAARLLRRAPLADRPEPRRLRQAVLVQTAAWLVGGLHLWLLAFALGASPGPAAGGRGRGYARVGRRGVDPGAPRRRGRAGAGDHRRAGVGAAGARGDRRGDREPGLPGRRGTAVRGRPAAQRVARPPSSGSDPTRLRNATPRRHSVRPLSSPISSNARKARAEAGRTPRRSVARPCRASPGSTG